MSKSGIKKAEDNLKFLFSREDLKVKEIPKHKFQAFKDKQTNSIRIGANDYNAYIKSTSWKTRRTNWIVEVGRRCESCAKTYESKNLHAHHLTYDRLGYEHRRDVAILCRWCHRKAHDDGSVWLWAKKKFVIAVRYKPTGSITDILLSGLDSDSLYDVS